MDFFTCFTHEKTPQNNFLHKNFSIENNYLLSEKIICYLLFQRPPPFYFSNIQLLLPENKKIKQEFWWCYHRVFRVAEFYPKANYAFKSRSAYDDFSTAVAPQGRNHVIFWPFYIQQKLRESVKFFNPKSVNSSWH